jgi:hypothetical protein
MFLKHGWPSAPFHGTNMARKKIKTTPLDKNAVQKWAVQVK